MLRSSAAVIAALLAVPGAGATAADKAPLTIRAKATGPANSLMRVYWKQNVAAADNLMRVDKVATFSIPGTIYVGTALQRGDGSRLHRWRFNGDFLQRTGIKNGLQLELTTDPNGCPAISALTRLRDQTMSRTSVEGFLSRIIYIGHLREVCRTLGMRSKVAAADKAIEDLYGELRRRVPTFRGDVCSAGGDCPT